MAHQSLLSMQAITKDFPGVRALNHVSFTLEAGQVHGLLGANGAGKSTLIKVLGGLFDDYSGQILLDGEEVNIRSPRQAAAAGIALIHQEFNLHPQLTVAENILLGREPLRKIAGVPFLNWRQLYAQAEEFLTEIGFDLPIREKVGDLGVAGQQLVQIAKALVQKARILVMDEPTARLSSNEREDLFRVIKRLKTSGVGIIYISHFIEEVFMIADQITVLRDGQVVVSKPSPELDHRTVVNLMVGREVSQTPVDAAPPADTPVLEVEHFSSASAMFLLHCTKARSWAWRAWLVPGEPNSPGLCLARAVNLCWEGTSGWEARSTGRSHPGMPSLAGWPSCRRTANTRAWSCSIRSRRTSPSRCLIAW